MSLIICVWLSVEHHISNAKPQDNGFQVLFLSARAISQAYLTRKFLLNLKQVRDLRLLWYTLFALFIYEDQIYMRIALSFFLKDGEALPEGPVFISPDGLLPSLYREGKFIK